MNTSGDAAEQVVRLSLEGMEVAAKITGSAAKEVAALLYAALKNRDKNKIKGRQRLTSMLRSGKELTIFTVKNKDMARFVADAKRYGVVYCVLREAKDNPHGVSEIMVRAEDAAKINRIVENIKIATVSDPEVIRENAETGRDKNKDAAGQTAPEQSDAVILVVSEETGTISLARNGTLQRYLTADDVKEFLKASITRPKADFKQMLREKIRDLRGDKK